MKPITADSRLGIVLLALRAGPMTPDQFAERWPTGHNLAEAVRLDLAEKAGDEYRLTEAGRAAVPLRNPLAATVAPAIHSPEVFTMPKGETRITRDQVLAAIKEAGSAGINRKHLLERFGCSESNMDNHLMNLAKMHAIFRPKPGHCVAAGLVYDGAAEPEAKPAPRKCSASREAVKAFLQGKGALSPQAIADGINATLGSTESVLRGLWAGLQVEREKVEGNAFYFLPESAPVQPTAEFDPAQPAPADEFAFELTPAAPGELEEVEQIEVTAVGDRRGPVVISDAADLDIGMFSSGRLEISVGRDTIVIEPGAMKKLRGFLGLFQEAA